MGVTIQNGVSVITTKDAVKINGMDIPLPKGMKTNTSTIINGRVFIGGFEYIPDEKKFKRTFGSIMDWIFW